MKITIYTLVPIILLTFLYNNSLLPYNVFFILFVFIGLYGSFLFLNTLASIWSKDSINYQEYFWLVTGPDSILIVDNDLIVDLDIIGKNSYSFVSNSSNIFLSNSDNKSSLL